MRVAVIGSGISGLAAAWLLDRRHEVHLFEKQLRLGGHTHTVMHHVQGRTLPLDTGFIVYNEATYPNLTRVFAALGISDEEAERKFGFFLNPFDYGAPPHGGFAFGLDRLVGVLAGEENIREVTAFPKTQSGQDPMTNSPIPGDPKALAELGLKVLPPAT